jgi:8-oxo-dGTP pyrophosphatase MutT (NUDIX family)
MDDCARTWDREGSEAGPDLILFRARFDRMSNPRTKRRMRAVVLEAPDWVNVTAVTPEGKIVVVRQYRFGTGAVTAEIPAGIVDPGESHEAAAKRELREETGYESDRWDYLGFVEPNPAFLDNRCHHWRARDARCTCDPEPDECEDIEVCELAFDEVLREIAEGRMRHSLAVSALAHGFDLRAIGKAGC